MGVEYQRYLLPRPCSYRPAGHTLVRLIEALRADRWVPSAATRCLHGLGRARGAIAHPALGFVQRAAPWQTPAEFRVAGLSPLPDPLSAPWFDAHLDARLVWDVFPVADDGAPVDAEAASEDLLYAIYGVRYPLRPIDQEGDTPYYQFAIHWAEDYVLPPGGECAETETFFECDCGADLERDESDMQPRVRRPFQHQIRAVCRECDRPFDAAQATTTLTNGWDRTRTELDKGGVLHRFAIHVDCGKCFPHHPPAPSFHPELKALCEEVLGIPMVEAGWSA